MEINRKSVLSVAVVLLVFFSGCLGGQSTTETEPKQNQSSDGVQNGKSRTVTNDSAKLNRSGTWREGSKFTSLRTAGGLIIYKENSSNHRLKIELEDDGYEVSGTWYMNLSSPENASVKKERVKRYAHSVCQEVAKLSYNFSGFVSEYGKTETEILFGNPKFPSKMIRESQVEETTSGNSVQVIVRGKSSDSMLAGCKISGEKSIGLEMMVGE